MKIQKFNESITDNISLITFNEVDTLQKIISESTLKLEKYYDNINHVLLEFLIMYPELVGGDELDINDSLIDSFSLSNDKRFYLSVNYWYDYPHSEDDLQTTELTEEQVKKFILFYSVYISSKKYNI